MVSFVQEKLGKSNLYSNTLSPAVPLISKVSFNLVSMSFIYLLFLIHKRKFGIPYIFVGHVYTNINVLADDN